MSEAFALDNGHNATGVGGVKVSIVAFQAIDPGSIPGWRSLLRAEMRTVLADLASLCGRISRSTP